MRRVLSPWLEGEDGRHGAGLSIEMEHFDGNAGIGRGAGGGSVSETTCSGLSSPEAQRSATSRVDFGLNSPLLRR
jgi:hypothetical protein